MKKVFLVIFLTQFLTMACQADTFHYYKDGVDEMLQDPKTRKFTGGEGDVDDLSGCEILVEMSEWQLRKSGSYGRSQFWKKGTMNTETGVALDLPTTYFKNLNILLRDKLSHPIYVGHWQHSSKLEKPIRFFAYTGKGGGSITYQYESQTPENKNIPEKKFSLPPNAKIAPDRFSLCVVKWTAKFGYNAIAEVKSKNHWSKNYLVPTGRIIDSETAEVIYDANKNLQKNLQKPAEIKTEKTSNPTNQNTEKSE